MWATDDPCNEKVTNYLRLEFTVTFFLIENVLSEFLANKKDPHKTLIINSTGAIATVKIGLLIQCDAKT